MKPQILKYRLWRMAQRMNPQTGILQVRQASITPGTPDTFTTQYSLLRLVYKPPTLEDLNFTEAAVSTQYGWWTIFQVDLDNAQSPAPALRWQLVINGQTWIIERINVPVMRQSFECFCRLAN